MNIQVLLLLCGLFYGLIQSNKNNNKYVFKITELLGRRDKANSVYHAMNTQKPRKAARKMNSNETIDHFRCAPHEVVLNVIISSDCHQFSYKSYYCSGYCKSWSLGYFQTIEENGNLKPCCKIEHFDYQF